MKAVWLNSVGEVFDILDDQDGFDLLGKMAYQWRVVSPGDTIRLVEDDDENYIIGSHYDEKGRKQ